MDLQFGGMSSAVRGGGVNSMHDLIIGRNIKDM